MVNNLKKCKQSKLKKKNSSIIEGVLKRFHKKLDNIIKDYFDVYYHHAIWQFTCHMQFKFYTKMLFFYSYDRSKT